MVKKHNSRIFTKKCIFRWKSFFECMKRHEIVTRCWRIEKNVNELENFPCSNQNPLELLYPRERCHRAFHLTKRKKKEYLETFYLAPKLYLNFCSFFYYNTAKIHLTFVIFPAKINFCSYFLTMNCLNISENFV